MELRNKALLLAGVGSCGMAAVHLLLPQAYGWRQYLDLVPQRLASAILAVNFVFSFLILWGGCLTIMAALRRRGGRAGHLVLYALALFWTVYVLYQTRVPPPIPEYPRKLLLVVAAGIALMYLLFLFTRPVAEKRQRSHGPS